MPRLLLSAQERVALLFSAPGRKRLTPRTLMMTAPHVVSMASAEKHNDKRASSGVEETRRL
jgi:hypothetical protein